MALLGLALEGTTGMMGSSNSEIWWLLFEHAYDPTLVVDRHGQITHANAAVEQHPAGLPRAELIGRRFLDFVAPAARPAADQAWEEVITHHAPLHVETELERRLGGVVDVSLSFTPLPDSELFIVTLHDLNQQAALYQRAQQRANHMAVLNAISEDLSQTLELDKLLHIALSKSLKALGVEAGAIMLVAENGQELVFTAQQGWQQHDCVAESVHVKIDAGLPGRVVRTGRVSVSADVAKDPRIKVPVFRDEGIKAMAMAPMRARNGVAGVLSVMSHQHRTFDRQEQQLLAAVADRIGLALDNSRLYTRILRRLQEQSALHEIAMATQGILSLQTVMEQGLRALVALFELDAAAIHFVDKRNRVIPLTFQGSATKHWQQLQAKPPRLEDTLAGRYAAERRSLIVQDRETFGEREELQVYAKGMRTIAAVPLVASGRLIGILDLNAKRPNALALDDRPLLESLSAQLASAIEAARLHEQTEQRVQDLTTLTWVSASLNRTLDLDMVLHIVLDEMLTLVNPPSGKHTGVIFLAEPDQRRLRLAVARGLPDDAFVDQSLPVSRAAELPLLLPGTSLEEILTSTEVIELPPIDGAHPAHAFAGEPLVAIPLRVEERPIGVILVAGRLSGDEMRRLLVTLSDMAAVSIEKAYLYQETQRGLREMTTLFNFAQFLSSHLHMEALLQTVVTSLQDVLGCSGVTIALLDQESQVLEIKAAAGLKEEWHEKARLRADEGIMEQVAATGQRVYIPDVRQVAGISFYDHTFHSLLLVPLISKKQVIGILSIDHQQPNAFDADVERLVTIAAAQAAVAIENARLYKDLQERATSLAQAYEELKEIDRMKDELVQNVSHELRTPLTFVRGYVDLILHGDMGPLNERQHQALDIVSQKTASVAHLVDNIMLLQRLEYSALQFALTDLVTVASEVVSKAQTAAQQHGVALHLKAPPQLPLILSDPERIILVFQHLLENAIKFSPNGGTVHVQLEERADCIQVCVSDQGIGISQDQMQRIFERFYQIDSSTERRFEGTGLGLSIVKRIVEAHDGEIWVKSRLGKGSTFFLTLPKSRQGHSQESPKSDSENPQ
jgi:PAS domain S-box-containing protein